MYTKVTWNPAAMKALATKMTIVRAVLCEHKGRKKKDEKHCVTMYM